MKIRDINKRSVSITEYMYVLVNLYFVVCNAIVLSDKVMFFYMPCLPCSF